MGCFDAKTSFELPKWIKRPTKQIGAGVQKALGQEFTPYEGDRAADLSGTQTDAMSMFRDFLGPNGSGAKLPRLIDDIPGTGPLAGSIADYMDPYLASVLAPVLRELGTSRTNQLQSNDAARHMAGAYGDTGAALERVETNRLADQTMGDATGKISSDAFRTAMGMRGDDINRLAANRGQSADWLKDLFNMGGVEQATNQRGLDADWEEFLREINFDWDKLAKGASITGSLPTGQMTQSPSTAGQIMGGLSSAAALLI